MGLAWRAGVGAVMAPGCFTTQRFTCSASGLTMLVGLAGNIGQVVVKRPLK